MDAAEPTGGESVGSARRSRQTLGTEYDESFGVDNPNEWELLLDIAESLRHICAHADAAETHGRAITKIFAAVGQNKKLRKFLSIE
jgi:hypothetical protein